MASVSAIKKMREEATCSLCQELMTEPVSINCGHSYCRSCIVGKLGTQMHMTAWLGRFYCPKCEAPFTRGSIRPNKQLESVIDYVKEVDVKWLCEEHKEILNIFCEDDSQLICSRCERKPEHKGHLTAHVEDVCQSYKEEIQKATTKLKQLEDHCNNLLLCTREQIISWEENIEFQKKNIHSDFEDIHIFLYKEEISFINQLEKEKEKTKKRLQNNEAMLLKQSVELKNYVLELEKKCQGSAQNLLQDVKDTLSRSSAVKLTVPEAISLKVRTVCDVSERYFDVKKKSKNL